MNFKKGDWVYITDPKSSLLVAQITSEVYESTNIGYGGKNTRSYIDTNLRSRIDIYDIRLATNEDFVQAVNKLKARIKGIELEIEVISSGFNQYLKSRNFSL